MFEFVSRIPTGPMHVCHGRGAAYGESIAKLMAATGWTFWREYYIHDAGRQVDILAISVWLRYLDLCGETLPFPKRGYPADYIKYTAKTLKNAVGESLKHDAKAVLFGLDADTLVPDRHSAPEKVKHKLQPEA